MKGMFESFTFSVQQKKGLLHSADRMFLDKCRTAHTCGDFRDEDRINICTVDFSHEYVPVVHYSYKTTIVYHRQRIRTAHWNNVHDPAIELEIVQSCCISTLHENAKSNEVLEKTGKNEQQCSKRIKMIRAYPPYAAFMSITFRKFI